MNVFQSKKKPIPSAQKGAVTVLIAAGGSGERMGGVSKPLIKLCGVPAIEYSLSAFSACKDVTSIYISAKQADVAVYEEYVKSNAYPKLKGVVVGGDTRFDSVKNALTEAFSKETTDFIAIHDGARPLITTEEIERAIALCKKHGSGVCASRVSDTVKRASIGGRVTESVERDGLWLISTPQVFDTDIYHTALATAILDGFTATDDSSLLEHSGFTVMLSETSRQNIKLTYPEDIETAQAILYARKQKNT